MSSRYFVFLQSGCRFSSMGTETQCRRIVCWVFACTLWLQRTPRVMFMSRTTGALSPSVIRTPGSAFFNKSQEQQRKRRGLSSRGGGIRLAAGALNLWPSRRHFAHVWVVESDYLCEVSAGLTSRFRCGLRGLGQVVEVRRRRSPHRDS